MADPIRPRAVLVPLLFLVLASAGPGAEAARAMRFRHGLVPATAYDLESRMNLRIVADMGALDPTRAEVKPGQGEEGAPPESGGAKLLEMRQVLTMRSLLKVGEKTAEGDLPLECNIEDLSGTMELAGQAFEVPGIPDEARTAGFRGRLLKGGRQVQVETTGLDDLPPDTRQMLSQILQVLPTFPERKLKVGDSFENPVDFELPGLPTGAELDTRGSVTYTLTRIEGSRAHFETRAELSAHALEGADGARSTSLSGTLQGTAVFDRELGVFTSHTATLAMDLALEMDLPGGAAEQPATTSVKASASGPVEITLTPAGDKPR